MTNAIFIALALLLASLPTLRSSRRFQNGASETTPPAIVIKGALAGLSLACVFWLFWTLITAMSVGAFVVWSPSLWLVGVALGLTWWRACTLASQSPLGTRGLVYAAFTGAQVAMTLSVIGLFSLIGLPPDYIPEIERKGLGWALVSLVPPTLAWTVAFLIPRLTRREPRRPWAIFFTLGGVALLLALTMALPGMVIGASFRGGQIALLGLPWTFLCVMIVPVVGGVLALASPASEDNVPSAKRAGQKHSQDEAGL
jgi:hypothetical protein